MMIAGAVFTGCDSSDVTPTAATPDQTGLEGSFVDSMVVGIQYKTDTLTGITGPKGKFKYKKNERVKFFLGDIVIGEALAKPVMTPVDIVEGAADETDPAVTNIARFLQTIDDDDNPENGILITEAVRNASVGISMNFKTTVVEFQNDPVVLAAVSDLTKLRTCGIRLLALTYRVQLHLKVTLSNLDNYEDLDGDGYSVEDGDCDDTDPDINPDNGCEGEDPGETPCTETPNEGTWSGTTDQGYDFSFALAGNSVSEINTKMDYQDYNSENCVGSNMLMSGDKAVDVNDCSFAFSTADVEVIGTFTSATTAEGTWFYQNSNCGGAGNGTWTASIAGSSDVDEDGDGYTADQDCNDADATVNPGAEEICGDEIDQDCIDGDLACSGDSDGDGITEEDGDCDDTDATVYPGAEEICGDGIDQDCDESDLICIDDDGEKVDVC
ncbi:MAG: hypothetical protein GY751_12655, partial [Bacteroidetes bacterium]|nr:hypothetical protein [Bacteroidota bacterium]